MPKGTKWSNVQDEQLKTDIETRFGSRDSQDGKPAKLDILKQAGITHHERYEAIAGLPKEEFEKHIEEVKKSNEELTTIGVVRLARKLNEYKKAKTPPLPKDKIVDSVHLKSS